MKNIYIAATVKEKGKYYSCVIKAGESDNLLSVLSGVKGLISANIWPKARAEKAVEIWNNSYKANGNYLFAETFA